MTQEQFDVLYALGIARKKPIALAVRDVLVRGATQSAAAAKHNVPPPRVTEAVQRFTAAAAVIRQADWSDV